MPAAYWVGVERADPLGWLLWALVWFQSSASIVYAYLRLEQRSLREPPDMGERLRMGRRALMYTSFNALAVIGLSLGGVIPALLPFAYALQWGETLWGSLIKPAVGARPTAIGIRQLAISILFTVLFIAAWRI